LEVEKWSTIWIDNPAIAEGLVNNPGFEGGGFSGGGDSAVAASAATSYTSWLSRMTADMTVFPVSAYGTD